MNRLPGLLILLSTILLAVVVGACGVTTPRGAALYSAALEQTATTWPISSDSAAALLARSRSWFRERSYRLESDLSAELVAVGPASADDPIRIRVSLTGSGLTGSTETVVDVHGTAAEASYRDQADRVARSLAHFLQTGRTLDDYLRENP